jgi:hypothetical protein
MAIPEEFSKIIPDFITDITNTFPEYNPIINKWWNGEDVDTVFKHCVQVFPDRFFDILYQNEEIFSKDSDVNTEFLPGISFKYMWQCDISSSTKATIWKYLQLILIAIIGCVKDKDSSMFGDTSKLFENINEDDFKGKLEETIEKMQGIFDRPASNKYDDPPLPDLSESQPDAIQDQLSGMLNGKLGNLAREIAEETADNMDISMDNVTDVKDIFQSLFKNPGKLMGLVKNVGDKLDSRIKSGEINQSELIAEAGEMMSKMKNMPGMDNIQGMLSKMGMGMGGGGNKDAAAGLAEMMGGLGGLGGLAGLMGGGGGGGGGGDNGGKVDVTKMERAMKAAQTKERLKKKMEAKHLSEMMAQMALQQQQQTAAPATTPLMSDDELVAFFNECDKAEKTPRRAQQSVASATNDNKKKKKNK